LKDLAKDASIPGDQRVWILTSAAETAERLDNRREAEELFKRALALDPVNTYTLAALADFLLAHDRAREAFALVKDRRESDALLQRRAESLKAIDPGSAEYLNDCKDIRERFEAARRRGDFAHLREEARAKLRLENDCNAAVSLALRNWQVQREPADARILLESATAAKNNAAIDQIRAWVNETRLEDKTIEQLLNR